MIYFDNSATTFIKPKEVGEAVKYAIDNFGNPSRSINEMALLAAREIYKTREQLAKLINLDDPLKIAFTSGATESLNLVIHGLINKDDHVITTVLEHNSVLRPLYNSGCNISFVGLDNENNIDYHQFDKLIQSNTKAIVITHASNVIGSSVDVTRLYKLAQDNNLYFILDASQSLGSIPVTADMADIICFTGHKSLFGPQGTGGIIMRNDLPISITKTGGAGSNSFARFQASTMPDIFEVGTPNAHGLYGLKKGVEFINETSLECIISHKKKLTELFIAQVSGIAGIEIYSSDDNIGVVALNYRDTNSALIAEKLYEEYKIATRAQSHCAPLLHEFFNTEKQGMVRFSFSYFNTVEEVEQCVLALKNIISERK